MEFPRVLVLHADDDAPYEVHGVVIVSDAEELRLFDVALSEWENGERERGEWEGSVAAWLKARGLKVTDLEEIWIDEGEAPEEGGES